MGFGLLALFRNVLGSDSYARRTFAFLRFLVIFLREFLWSNAVVIATILFKSRASMYPNFITLDVSGMEPYEILILSYCITLTPGTTSVEIEDNFKTLIFHSLNAEHPKEIRTQIERTLKDGILRFTR